MRTILLVFILFSLFACKPAEKKAVLTDVSTYLTGMEISVSPGMNLGEMEMSGDSSEITVIIKNTSEGDFTNLSLTIGSGQSYLKFQANATGTRKSPGAGGSCGTVLKKKTSCSFKFGFVPVKMGRFNIPINLAYNNYIKPASQSFEFTGLVGEPADLGILNNLTTYNFGTLEQTDTAIKKQKLEITNHGDLTARMIAPILVNSDPAGAYSLFSNTCPQSLPGKGKCEIEVAYSPKNNSSSDFPFTYASYLTVDYLKNPANSPGKLNANFTFFSTRLEADFTPSSIKNLNFNSLVVGNKHIKELKIENIGYRAGIVKALIVGSDFECSKNVSGIVLLCKKNGLQATLEEFPFIVEDTNSCFGNSVEGVVGKNPGQSCSISVTYWPSINNASNGSFLASDIYLKYDSRWLGVQGTIITKKIAKIPEISFYGVGKLAFDHVELTPPGLPKLPNILPDPGPLLEANIGVIPLFQQDVDAASTFFQVKVIFKNIGLSPVKVKKIVDGATVPLEIIPGVNGSLSSGYYLKVTQSSCDNVAASGSCIITYNLVPKPKLTEDEENILMYDFIDGLMPSLNYKLFKLIYSDGSTVNNSNVAIADKEIEVHIKSKLERNGVLVVESPSSIRYSGIGGQIADYLIRLRNIGTGNLILSSSLNQMFNPPAGFNNDWAWRLIDNPADPENCGIYNSADKNLASNESCRVLIRAELPETSRISSFGYYDEFNRSFVNQGERISASTSSFDIYFKYYSSVSDLVNVSESNQIKVTSTYYSEANLVPQKPLPSTSAILYRPAMNNTTLSVTYPQAITLNAVVIPESYFDSKTFPFSVVAGVPTPATGCPAVTLNNYTYENCYNRFFKSPESIKHVKDISSGDMLRVSGEYIFHAGTFPVGEEVSFNLGFINSGIRGAGSIVMVEEADPTSPLSIKSILPVALGSKVSTPPVKFSFKPLAAGIYSRCYDLNYNSGLSARSTRVCVYAEAADPDYMALATKLVKIEYSDDFSTYTDITSGLNSIDDANFASFFVVNGSGMKIKKRFKITNNRNVAVNKLSYYILESPTSTPKNLTGALSSSYINLQDGSTVPAIDLTTPLELNPSCSLGMTLNSGASCVVDINYEPTDTEGLRRNYLGVIFEIAPDQYVSYSGALSFRSAPPTKLTVVNVTFQDPITPTSTDLFAITDTITGAKQLRSGSFGISINKDPNNPKKYPYILANADVSNTFEYRVVNSSTLKTSFMPAWKVLHPSDTFPVSGTDILIYTSATASITANRACFFGDDEGDASVPSDFKGFFRDTQNICRMKIAFSGYRTYTGASCDTQQMGGSILNSCNPFSYAMAYSTTDGVALVNEDLNIHMQGYIEPNKIVSDTFELSDVVAKSNGSVRIAVSPIYPNHANRGALEVGLVCYDKDYMKLKSDKVFNLIKDYTYISGNLVKVDSSADIENCVSFTNDDQYVNIAGLSVGSYYFFKVFAMRSFSNGVEQDLKYISNSSILTSTAVIPSADQIYNHETKQLIDKSIKLQVGTRDFAINTCNADFTNFDIVGVKYKAYKGLINTSIFNYLISDPSYNSGYPTEGVGAITHWLSDTPYDISASISLYDGSNVPGFSNYTVSAMDGTNVGYKASYHQTCNNNPSCSLLYKLVGGDPGEGLYFEGVFYTTGDGANAAIRCYRELLCPTNPQLSINSQSCLQP